MSWPISAAGSPTITAPAAAPRITHAPETRAESAAPPRPTAWIANSEAGAPSPRAVAGKGLMPVSPLAGGGGAHGFGPRHASDVGCPSVWQAEANRAS